MWLRLRSNHLLNATIKEKESASVSTIIGETTLSVVRQSDSAAAKPTSKMASSYIEM